VILLIAGIAAIILTLWMNGSNIIIFIATISVILLAAAYALSRTERYPIAAALTLITIWVSVISASIIFHDPEFLYFLFLVPLVSGQFLSPRSTILVSAASVITIILMRRVDPLLPIWHIVDSAFLAGLTGALATVSALTQRQDIQHIEHQSRDLSAHLIEVVRGREALQQSETRLAHILENAAEAIITTDETQNIILFNRGSEKIFGYQAGEVLGKPLDLLVPQRYAEAHRQHVTAFGADDQKSRPMAARQEVYGRRKDGTEFPAQVGISAHVESGRTIFTAILVDITERHLAEEQIRKNTVRTQALAEISQLIVEVGLNYHAPRLLFHTAHYLWSPKAR
jgi:PAS domain S-box-containing protein